MRSSRFAGGAVLVLVALVAGVARGAELAASAPVPLAVGETFTVESRALGETRRINVYRAPAWDESTNARRPVLVMPDGGIAEDFPHVAGLLQVSIGNGTMRPFLLVGIENTERRRDLTGPTANAQDRTIAPRVGGSAAFRAFVRDELLPLVRQRYATTRETAIVGESLAGLFAVETFLLAPDLFDTCLAFDPSLWWDDGRLVREAGARLAAEPRARQLYVASSRDGDRADRIAAFADTLRARAPRALRWEQVAMPAETHATIYHPAALAAFRWAFAPVETR